MSGRDEEDEEEGEEGDGDGDEEEDREEECNSDDVEVWSRKDMTGFTDTT